MKKLLFIAMMCFVSVGAFAKESSNYRKQCTAHYYLTVFSGGREYLIYSEITASTCAGAMSAAQNAANEIAEAY